MLMLRPIIFVKLEHWIDNDSCDGPSFHEFVILHELKGASQYHELRRPFQSEIFSADSTSTAVAGEEFYVIRKFDRKAFLIHRVNEKDNSVVCHFMEGALMEESFNEFFVEGDT